MAFFGKAVGGVLGGLIGGPLGAAFGVALGSAFDGPETSPLNPHGIPLLEVAATSTFDDCGELCTVRLATPLSGLHYAQFSIVDQSGTYVRANAPFADDDGDFCRTTLLLHDTCRCYIPYGALTRPSDGPLVLRVYIASAVGETLHPRGVVLLNQELPSRPNWSLATHYQPLLALLAYAATAASTRADRMERVLTDLCETSLGLTNRGRQLTTALAKAKAEAAQASAFALNHWIAASRLRYPDVGLREIGALLEHFLSPDVSPHSANVQAVKSVLIGYGMSETDWTAFLTSHHLDDAACYATLDIRPGATLDDVHAAYRHLMKQWHPDNFATSPPDVQATAQQRSIAIRHAYDTLRSRL